jgi:hypothetical protein
MKKLTVNIIKEKLLVFRVTSVSNHFGHLNWPLLVLKCPR